MKRFIPFLLILMLVSCVSLPMFQFPEEEGLQTSLAPYVEKYGDYDGFQIRQVLKDVNGEVQTNIVFVWLDVEVYVEFSFFNNTWILMGTNG